MTSAQLILVSVSSALIAVIAMLVVATVLRARARESTGSDLSQSTGPQTRAQRAAARAQRRAQRATLRAEKKAAKAAESLSKSEKKKAAALAAAKTEPPGKAPVGSAEDSATVSKGDSQNTDDAAAERPAGKASVDKAAKSGDAKDSAPATSDADGSPTSEGTDELIVPKAGVTSSESTEPRSSEEKADEAPTTEAGKKAAEAKPKTRTSLLGREKPADDPPDKKS